jgi:serine/threonine-protein kinase HipA
MRKAAVYYKDQFAGVLTETDEGEYSFQYDRPSKQVLWEQCFPFSDDAVISCIWTM